MGKRREVYIGYDKGIKIFTAIEHSEDGLKKNLYKMKASDMTKEQIDMLYQVWLKKGVRIKFPKHDHIVWDLTISSTIPEFAGINREESRKRLSHNVSVSLQEYHSNKHSDILSSEIKTLKNKVYSLNKKSDTAEFGNHIRLAISLQKKIKEARSKWEKNPKVANNWRERLSPKHAYNLFQSIQEIFERINKIKTEIEQDNIKILSNQYSILEKEVKKTSDFKETRQSLITFQKSLKDFYLSKDNRTIYFNKIQKLFDLLFKRQNESKKKYESECKKNFDTFQKKLISLDYQVNNSTDWKDLRKNLKLIQSDLKGLKLLKNQRDILWKKINHYFEIVNNRQNKLHEEYKEKCKKNELYLNPKIERCVSLSYNSKDWKYVRTLLKQVQSEIKKTKLDKTVRQSFFTRLQESFERLHNRQNAEYKKYEEESNTNYLRISSQVRDLSNSIFYSNENNLKELRKDLQNLQAKLKNMKMKRDKRQKVYDSLNECFESLNKKQNEYYEQRKRERERKRKEFLQRLRESAERLAESINHDERVVADKELKYYNVMPGKREYEIKNSIQYSISSIKDKIYSKKEKLDNIRRKIREVEMQK